MVKTNIPYANHNWETVGGCDKIKSGCKHCYAVGLIHRMNCCQQKKGRYKGLVKNGKWTGKITLFEDRVEQPLHRTIPTTYFVNSRSDLFHKDVPYKFIAKILAVATMCPQHTFLLFTKRWKRCLEFYRDLYELEAGVEYLAEAVEELGGDIDALDSALSPPMENVHLYFSASTQAEVDEAVPILLEIPVAVRGLSLEPLLESVRIPRTICSQCGQGSIERQTMGCKYGSGGNCRCGAYLSYKDVKLDSIILGCESGKDHRRCKIEWIHDLVYQCSDRQFKIRPYVKQIPIDGKCVPLNDDNRSIWPEWAVQEMPK